MLTCTCSFSKAPHSLKCQLLQQVRVTTPSFHSRECAMLPYSCTVSLDRTVRDLSLVRTDTMISSLKAEMLSLSPVYLDHLAQYPTSPCCVS